MPTRPVVNVALSTLGEDTFCMTVCCHSSLALCLIARITAHLSGHILRFLIQYDFITMITDAISGNISIPSPSVQINDDCSLSVIYLIKGSQENIAIGFNLGKYA